MKIWMVILNLIKVEQTTISIHHVILIKDQKDPAAALNISDEKWAKIVNENK